MQIPDFIKSSGSPKQMSIAYEHPSIKNSRAVYGFSFDPDILTPEMDSKLKKDGLQVTYLPKSESFQSKEGDHR